MTHCYINKWFFINILLSHEMNNSYSENYMVRSYIDSTIDSIYTANYQNMHVMSLQTLKYVDIYNT